MELIADGAVLPGYEMESCQPLVLDSQDEVVSWQEGSQLPEIPFQIKFYLQDSSIFAFARMD